MKKMYSITLKVVAVTLLLATICDIANCMTRAQLKQSGKVMKNVCMPKNKVTEEEVGTIDKGKFIDSKNVMCYVACIYQMAQMMKNGKLNYEGALKQIDIMFPEDMKAPVKAVLEKCKGISNNYKDICESSFYTAKCMYDADPANFFFP